MIGIKDLDISILLDVTGGNYAGACYVDHCVLHGYGMKLCCDSFYIKNDLGYILLHTVNGGDLMENAVDLNASYSIPGQ